MPQFNRGPIYAKFSLQSTSELVRYITIVAELEPHPVPRPGEYRADVGSVTFRRNLQITQPADALNRVYILCCIVEIN